MKLDVNFLQKHNLMDYSLLIQIENLKKDQAMDIDEDFLSRNQYISDNHKEIYHIGIIDYLQSFTNKKWVENTYKTMFKSKKFARTISCVPANVYGDRFIEFMTNEVFEAQRFNGFDMMNKK